MKMKTQYIKKSKNHTVGSSKMKGDGSVSEKLEISN